MFHRVQREGQLCVFYVLVMFGGAHVCLLVHVCVCDACMAMYVFGGPCVVCMCICIYADICVWWCMYVYMTHIYAPLIGDACGAHVCMWCIYVYVVHLCTHICVWGA